MAVLTPVLAYYLLVDWDRIRDRAAGLIPPRWQGTASKVGADIEQILAEVGTLLLRSARPGVAPTKQP